MARSAQYERAWKEFLKLDGPEHDYLLQPAIDDLVAAVELEIELVAEGEQEHTHSEMVAMRRFVHRWKGF